MDPGPAVLAAIALFLCAPMLAIAQQPEANGPPASTESAAAGTGSGTVYFFRGIKTLGAWIGYTIYDGGVRLGKLTSGTFLAATLPAGRHEFVVNSERQSALVLEIEPGTTSYVFATITLDVGRPALSVESQTLFEGMRPILKDVTERPRE
jgi:hypothetical protein